MLKRSAFLSLSLAACASAGLPYPRWAEVGRQWGCDPLEVQQARIEVGRTRPQGTAAIEVKPEIGWDACRMLAESGEPREVRVMETTDARAYHLTYRRLTGGASHLVTLRQDPAGVWRVDTVVW